jgi:ABC-type molybdate transport system permease subunit
MPMSLSETSRRLALAACTIAGTLALSAPAMAGTSLSATVFAGQTPVNECLPSPMSLPFVSLGDLRTYVLAPNGSFSDVSGGGWQFTGGAKVVVATRPVVGAGGVLNVPAGATALSPLMCVDLDYPTARAWTGGTGSLDINVVYPDSKKGLSPKSVGSVVGLKTGSWKLSSDFDVKPQIGGKYAGWRRVAFQLTNTSKSAVEVDDFYVDPRMR